MRGLHRVLGSIYTHMKPNLCPICAHRRPGQWEGICTAKGAVLCCPISDKGRCRDYKPAVP